MKKNVVEIMKEKKGEPIKGILTLENELSFTNVNDLLDNFNSNIHKFDNLILQGNIDSIDLTGIQAIYSIRSALKKNNKTLAIGIKMNEEVKNLILRAGFKELFETI